jgi:hypothetical protein
VVGEWWERKRRRESVREREGKKIFREDEPEKKRRRK